MYCPWKIRLSVPRMPCKINGLVGAMVDSTCLQLRWLIHSSAIFPINSKSSAHNADIFSEPLSSLYCRIFIISSDSGAQERKMNLRGKYFVMLDVINLGRWKVILYYYYLVISRTFSIDTLTAKSDLDHFLL